MSEDFEPGMGNTGTRSRPGVPQFGCEFDEGNAGFRAKKSKYKVVPDPNKCQIFSLSDMMMTGVEELQIPQKKPSNFPMPQIAK